MSNKINLSANQIKSNQFKPNPNGLPLGSKTLTSSNRGKNTHSGAQRVGAKETLHHCTAGTRCCVQHLIHPDFRSFAGTTWKSGAMLGCKKNMAHKCPCETNGWPPGKSGTRHTRTQGWHKHKKQIRRTCLSPQSLRPKMTHKT